jgi:hypothetical protein
VIEDVIPGGYFDMADIHVFNYSGLTQPQIPVNPHLGDADASVM